MDIQKAKAQLRNILYPASVSLSSNPQYILIGIIVTCGLSILLVTGVQAIRAGDVALGAVELSICIVLLATLAHQRSTGKLFVSKLVVTSMTGALFLLLFYRGGPGQSGHLWSFMLPSLYLFFYGRKLGSVLVWMYFVILYALLLAGSPESQLVEPVFLSRFCLVYLMVYLVMLFFESLRMHNLQIVKRQNQQLEELLKSKNEAEERLIFLAFNDSLTKLPNRKAFLEDLKNDLDQATRQPNNNKALMFVDLDGFKFVNDNFGHAAGDDVLVAFAQLLQALVRSSDKVYRIGGDEFIIFLRNMKKAEDVSYVAKKIIKQINSAESLNNKDFAVTASIGIALFPKNGTSSDELINRADAAMYKAKEQGKNRYCLYSE